MKSILTLFLICCLHANSCFGQQLAEKSYKPRQERKNALYGELLGSTFGLGINYERLVYADSFLQVNVRAGVGSIIFVNALPLVGVNCLLGKKAHRFELGINGVRAFAIELFGSTTVYAFANPVIGYRVQNRHGLIFRASFTPMIPIFDPDDWIADNRYFIPLGGISLGYAF